MATGTPDTEGGERLLPTQSLFGDHDDRSIGLVDDLLACAAKGEPGMTPRAAASYDDEIGALLERSPEEGCDGIAVDNHTAMSHGSLDERSTPLLLEQGDQVISLPHRRHDRPVVEASQQAHGVDRHDLPVRAFDEGCRPCERTRGVTRAIDADDDAAWRTHPCRRKGIAGLSSVKEIRRCMTVTPNQA